MTAAKSHAAPKVPMSDAEAERWWWDEVGVLVEHEVWHLPRLTDAQDDELR